METAAGPGSSIHNKLMRYFLVLVSLPLATLGILGPVLYARSIEEQTTAHTVQMIGQVSRSIEYRVRETEKIISLLELNPEVRQFFGLDNPVGPASRELKAREAGRLGLELANLRQSHPEVAGILLVDANDQPFSRDLERITRDPLTQEGWYREAAARPDAVRLFARPIGRNIRSVEGYSDDEVVAVAKAVRHQSTGQVAGVVLIDLRVAVIARIFQDTNLGQQGFLFVSDAAGGTIYAPRNDVIHRIPAAALQTSHPVVLGINTRSRTPRTGDSPAPAGPEPARTRVDFRVMSQQSDYTGWITSAAVSLDETLKEIVSVRIYALLIGGLTFALAIVVAFIFAASVARPVIGLEQLMKRAEAGDLEARWQGRGNDEISRLGHSFNTMIKEIQNLIAQVYRDQMIQREAELRILQEQIKPHFLYNTLDTIQWMARDHGAGDIVSLVEALTTLFRIGLNRGREMIPLDRELDHVRSYLCIQKARYEDKFDWSLEADESLGGYFVIKLILQPLVENAIYHGIKERRGKGRLAIQVGQDGADLLLRVSDDGAGLAAGRREDLNRRLAEGIAQREDTGYGMFNVNERIRLRFGPAYGVRFVAQAEPGCTVEIRHPLVEVDA